jgi:hypothetical protein
MYVLEYVKNTWGETARLGHGYKSSSIVVIALIIVDVLAINCVMIV